MDMDPSAFLISLNATVVKQKSKENCVCVDMTLSFTTYEDMHKKVYMTYNKIVIKQILTRKTAYATIRS